METNLLIFLAIPFIGLLTVLFLPSRLEKGLSNISIIVSMANLVLLLAFSMLWFLGGKINYEYTLTTLFKNNEIHIFVQFLFDRITLVFGVMGAIIMLAITLFSKYYLHRDKGYKKYFVMLMLFFLSYNIVVFSGNFETLFIGWEFIGVCSFILIGFYQNRFLPQKNSLKVISTFRIGDIALILATWLSHHIWHKNVLFSQLLDKETLSLHLKDNYNLAVFLVLLIVVAALVKSAQFPFSYWLPRALEGPTSSSALFYGALSTHIGVFLLLRTYPYWSGMNVVVFLIIGISILTFFITTFIARVQSSVKVQIAYFSIAQIGLIFIEIAIGWHTLALLHTAGNMMFRTYQLLVSPSVLGYRIHNMVFGQVKQNSKKNSVLLNSIFVLSIKEWNMDSCFKNLIWSPLKFIGKQMNKIPAKITFISSVVLILVGSVLEFSSYHNEHGLLQGMSVFLSLWGLLILLKSFASKKNAITAWTSIMLAQFLIALSIGITSKLFGPLYMLLFFGGTILAFIVGYICLYRIHKIDTDIVLNRFHGYSYLKPKMSIVFLICSLCAAGLPITPTFIGMDVMFSHIDLHQIPLITITSISFLVLEIAVFRIYTRIFLGPFKENTHAMPYTSS